MFVFKKIAFIVGSRSDLPKIDGGLKILEKMGISCDVKVLSAHRTPEEVRDFAIASEGEYDCIIAAAGKAAHLAGVIASHTTIPVIGVPIKSVPLDGMVSLLSIVEMPKGVPVATVGIDNAENAALLAAEIIALGNSEVGEALKRYREEMRKKVLS
ncbi:5-(carboxyamino)imidazole ribonucleotide mutase [Calorimonas adulescens]|uniref:N5-carboxyaminoimidazole ribonucleotide mutase n=1 Tax=Calorimonas adulescens TaxID=2606906 RepID=A0A5D8QEE5_9THEO|nr:5-(carboxyamino)imidazole ribonucleotide mutase [Calorimonas adulescens]TZE82554.1 5-(carboxyamino)imidazole ribonucleotide mutase [Calorimonas adulescens]